MADAPIHEWIQEWQNIKPLDIKSYAASLMADHETTEALLRVFEDPSLHHLLDDVCGQLLTFYRSREPNLVHFSLQCLPPLMHAYLQAVASRNQQTCKPTETLLLGMYNLEVVDERGLPRVVSFRMPTLIKQSVYHMPLHMAPSSLTEHSLSRLELGDAFSVEWGPLPQAQRIRAANRQRVLSALMTVYNRYLSQMSEPALQAACRAIIRICGQGFTMTAPPLDPRLTVSPELQLEFLHAIYFIITPSLHLDPGDPTYTYCRYESVTPAASQALEAVTFRGQYEVNARVIVAANAMRNSLNISPAGLTDSQLNLNEIPSVTSLPSVNKFIITNASFRTKKLPDDIPIQAGATHDGEPLAAISEQTEDEQAADAPAAKANKLKDRKHRPAERERSGPDKHVTAMLAALPALVKKRAGDEKRRLDSGGERGSGAERGARKGDSKRSGRRPASTAAAGTAGATNGAPSSARNSLALNGDEDWTAPPLARIEAGELRVVSSGSESATPRRERRETDSSSVTSTASDEAAAAAAAAAAAHGRSEPVVVYAVRRESLAVTAAARSTDV